MHADQKVKQLEEAVKQLEQELSNEKRERERIEQQRDKLLEALRHLAGQHEQAAEDLYDTIKQLTEEVDLKA